MLFSGHMVSTAHPRNCSNMQVGFCDHSFARQARKSVVPGLLLLFLLPSSHLMAQMPVQDGDLNAASQALQETGSAQSDSTRNLAPFGNSESPRNAPLRDDSSRTPSYTDTESLLRQGPERKQPREELTPSRQRNSRSLSSQPPVRDRLSSVPSCSTMCHRPLHRWI